MPYTVPDADDLKERYAAFESVAEDKIEYWITDAQRIVTTGWIEGDFGPAIMALAAHNMAMNNLGGGATGTVGGMTGVESFKSGTFSANFSADAVKAGVEGGYDATPYGKEFRVMLRRNRAGPRVTGPLGLRC